MTGGAVGISVKQSLETGTRPMTARGCRQAAITATNGWQIRRRAVGGQNGSPVPSRNPAHAGHPPVRAARRPRRSFAAPDCAPRSEEHTSELQSLMRISYAVFCLKKKKSTDQHTL